MTTDSRIAAFLKIASTITNRSRSGPDDRQGSPTWLEEDPIEAFGYFHPLDAEEQVDRPTGLVTWRGYYAADVGVRANASIVIPGHAFEVASAPAEWIHPSQGAAYLTVDLVERITHQGAGS